MKRHLVVPTQCLDEAPSSKTVRLGGRFINITRLAEYGFDHGYLSYILSGARTPSVGYGKRIAKCLGILDEDGQPDFAALLKLIRERKNDLELDYNRRLSGN